MASSFAESSRELRHRPLFIIIESNLMSDAPLPLQLEKKQKQKKQNGKGQRDPQQPAPTPATPLLREFLDVPGVSSDPERKLTIMTYNVSNNI